MPSPLPLSYPSFVTQLDFSLSLTLALSVSFSQFGHSFDMPNSIFARRKTSFARANHVQMNGAHSHLLHQCRHQENCLRESLSPMLPSLACQLLVARLSIFVGSTKELHAASAERMKENFRLAKFILLNQLNSRWLKSTYTFASISNAYNV